MFGSLLRSLSGSLAELTRWDAGNDRGEMYIRSGLEKSVLFLLCSTLLLGTSCIVLGISQQSVMCDKGLAFWNGAAGVLMYILSLGCATAIFFDTNTLILASKLIDSNLKSNLHEFGCGPFLGFWILCGTPILLTIWICVGYADVVSSATCRNTAPLLFGGSIANMALMTSALSFSTIMVTYFAASAKGFYDIALLKCVCDPVGVVVGEVANKLPTPPKIERPNWPIIRHLPTLDQLKAKLPSLDVIKVYVKRICAMIFPKSIQPDQIASSLHYS